MRRILIPPLLLLVIASCAPITSTPPPTVLPPATEPAPTAEPASGSWWRDAVFYEIFVRSFNDTDGDGIGDFNGITAKLDYLQSLGVDALWLMPINPSPSYHGYDILNYYAVNPQYGSMQDFENLLAEAHKRDIRVIIDFVLNHTSSQHPWFADALRGTDSAYHGWYVWSNTATDGHWHPVTGDPPSYYYGYFGDHMPDLNYANPDVTQGMEDVARYWLTDIGVDGFRLDAAKHLIEEDGKLENTPATHDWYRDFYTAYKAAKPDAYVVGEVYGAGGLIAKTYTGDQMDQVFNFELASGAVSSASGGANSSINSALKFTLPDMPDGNYATFLTNHDQNRVMSVLQGDVSKARVAAAILLTAPGVPFIYYGEEIGMTGTKPDEDIRRPMQWNADANAGFTTGSPWRAPAEDYLTTNVAAQDPDPASLLNYYRSLTQLRGDHSAMRTGDTYLLETANAGVYAILRVDPGEVLMVVINLKDAAISDFGLSLSSPALADGDYTLQTIFGGSGEPAPLQVVNGAFADYRPLEQLEAGTAYVFKTK
jgi:glycosidase